MVCYESVASMNLEKANGVLTAANNLLILFITSILSVFIPLGFTVAKNITEISLILMAIVFFAPIVIIPLFIFYFGKYREYRYKFKVNTTKSIIQELKNQNKLCNHTRTTLAQNISYITEFQVDEISKIINKIKDSGHLKCIQ